MDKNQAPEKPSADRRGRRYSTSERKRILGELANSGLSSNAFCRQQGYCYPTIRRWINQDVVLKPKKSSPSFLEVALHPTAADSKHPMVVELQSGDRIHIHNREHLAWAQVLMTSNKEKSC
jgi:transposase-like protein